MFKQRLILHPQSLSLTSGTAKWSGHSPVHDKQSTIQPRALHGHLYLLNARIQGSLPGLLPGEDGVALAADLSGRWTHSRCGRRKACRGKRTGRWIQADKRDAGGNRGPKGTADDSVIDKLVNSHLQQHTAYFLIPLCYRCSIT